MNEITLAALGIVATAVGAFVWIVKFLMTEVKSSLDKNTFSHNKVAEATRLNTKVSQETLTFMKNLNGRLAQIAAEKLEKNG